ncbi:Antirestriction protein [uncultured Clostridium sp.]|nr:Antirestriction protein [uncultured Clostridium sp.]
MLKIYVTNLSKYNEGALVGEWVNLPCEGLEEVLDKISNNGKDELFISDYETDISGLKVAEYKDILQLNEIAEEIDNFDDEEVIIFQAYLDQYANDIEQALEEVRQGNYTIYENCDNMEDVAYQAVNESGLLDGVPEQVKMYFDYEAYDRDMDINRTFIQIDNSFVELY